LKESLEETTPCPDFIRLSALTEQKTLSRLFQVRAGDFLSTLSSFPNRAYNKTQKMQE